MSTTELGFPPLIDPAELDRAEKHKQAVFDAAGLQVRPLGTPAPPDLTKIDLTDVALAMYGTWRKDVDTVKANLSTLVLDLSTPAKITEARSLRARLIAQPLAAARKVSAGIKSKMAATSKAVGKELEAIEAAYAEADKLILPKIEAREAELAREREEKQRIERERIEKHQADIALIRAFAEKAEQPDMTAARIAIGMEHLKAIPTPTSETWAEFAVEAADAICQTLERMRITHARVLRAEQAEEEAAELRAKLAAQAPAGPPASPIAPGEAITMAAIEQGAALIDEAASRVERAAGSSELAAAMEHIAGLTNLAPVIRAPGGPFTLIEPADQQPGPNEKPTLKLGDINDWLAPIQLTGAGLAMLGIEHSGTDKAAKLYKPSDRARIKAALIEHLEGLA